MASRFETAGLDELGTAFWSKTSTYSLAHIRTCWTRAIAWLESLDFLQYQSSTSTYLTTASLTAVGKEQEEAKWRDYLVKGFSAPLPLILRIRLSYKGDRNVAYKNTVVIDCCLSYGGVWTSWSQVYYSDTNENTYTNNRQVGAPYILYLSNNGKALCFAQGYFLSSANSSIGNIPIGSHGILVEYNDTEATLYGSVCYSLESISKYVVGISYTQQDAAFYGRYMDFKISAGVLSDSVIAALPTGGRTSAKALSNNYGYTYRNFIAVVEPAQTPSGVNVMVDGVSLNYAPVNIGFTMGSSSQSGRASTIYAIDATYWYYPIGGVCIYALIE